MKKYRYRQLFELRMRYQSLADEILRRENANFEIPEVFRQREREIRALIVRETAEIVLESCFKWRFLRYIYRPITIKIISEYYKKEGIAIYGRAEK